MQRTLISCNLTRVAQIERSLNPCYIFPFYFTGAYVEDTPINVLEFNFMLYFRSGPWSDFVLGGRALMTAGIRHQVVPGIHIFTNLQLPRVHCPFLTIGRLSPRPGRINIFLIFNTERHVYLLSDHRRTTVANNRMSTNEIRTVQ